MPILDAHAHVISPSAVERLREALPDTAPVFEDRPGGRFLVYPSGRESGPLPAGMTDLSVRLADMDRQGIDVQLISPSPPQFGYGLRGQDAVRHAQIVNDGSIELAERAPTRLLVLLTLPLSEPARALDELARLGDHPLVRGVELGANVHGAGLDDPSFEELWTELERRRFFVLVHAAPAETPQLARHFLRNLVGNPTDSTIAIASLIFGGVLERHPDLSLCFVHGGGFAPYQIGRWDRGWQLREGLRKHLPHPPSTYLPRLYFDSLTHDTASLRFLGERVGWDHVVLGSDYCFDMASDDPVADVRRLGLAPADEERVLSGNLQALLDGIRPGRSASVAPSVE
jgi:aminocarboxymuconate-semialdehyde decarboxylase